MSQTPSVVRVIHSDGRVHHASVDYFHPNHDDDEMQDDDDVRDRQEEEEAVGDDASMWRIVDAASLGALLLVTEVQSLVSL